MIFIEHFPSESDFNFFYYNLEIWCFCGGLNFATKASLCCHQGTKTSNLTKYVFIIAAHSSI